MKFRTMRSALALGLALVATPLMAQQIGFRDAVERALKFSGEMRLATAQRTKATAGYRVERSAYFPSINFGVSPGYSYGVAVSVAGQVPSIFSVTHTQTVFNLAVIDSVRAAHSDTVAAAIEYSDRADQTILDASLLYIELDNERRQLDAARLQQQSLEHALYIAQQRQKEGVASLLDIKRAELDLARAELRVSQLEASSGVAREKLARMIGVSAATLETDSASVPTAPALRSEQDLSSAALANSRSVQLADEHARAARLRARAEHRVNYPSVNFSGQFAEFASYLNYGLTYTPTHNYSFAFNINIPLLNLSQNAKAAAADAEAMRIEAEAKNTRDQVAAEAVRVQQAVRQLAAHAKVSRLEYEVAEANIDDVARRIQDGQASAHDQEAAKAEVAAQQGLLLQSQFECLRAQLQLMRQTGELRDWALPDGK